MAQQPAPGPASTQPLTVSQLATRIAETVAAGFKTKVWIVGEVSGFRERTHWYFDLKDAAAVVNCVMFAGAARKSGQAPPNGMQVLVSGRVEFYEKQGRVTLIVESVEPVGAGAQDAALRALVEELRKLGWLEEARKRELPSFPRRVGVVTSRTGAALQDVIDTMQKRCPAVGIVVVDARVQGDGAAGEVAAAIRWLGSARQKLGIDAVLVTRGGGSKEDLWAFNDRIVAEAIVLCPVPVVAAIGHETDTTIAELVADLRCSTPTQAAMRLTPDREALSEQVDAISHRLRASLVRDVREVRRRTDAAERSLRQAGLSLTRGFAHVLERFARRLETHRPAAAQARRQAALSTAQARLVASMRARLAEPDLADLSQRLARGSRRSGQLAAERLGSLSKRLTSVGPASVLNRGYSYTMREDGAIVRAVADARAGDVLRTNVSDGVVRSVVEGGSRTPPSVPAATVEASPAKPRRSGPVRDQMDLFGGGR